MNIEKIMKLTYKPCSPLLKMMPEFKFSNPKEHEAIKSFQHDLGRQTIPMVTGYIREHEH